MRWMAAARFASASTVPAFPLIGVGDFTEPAAAPNGPTARSLYIPDEAINPHPRFGALTANIRERRGSRPDVRTGTRAAHTSGIYARAPPRPTMIRPTIIGR